MTPDTQTLSLLNHLAHHEPADWLRQMIAYHQRTGTYRAQDVRRLFGDPAESITLSPGTQVANLLTPPEQS